jgi:hypothetical protein
VNPLSLPYSVNMFEVVEVVVDEMVAMLVVLMIEQVPQMYGRCLEQSALFSRQPSSAVPLLSTCPCWTHISSGALESEDVHRSPLAAVEGSPKFQNPVYAGINAKLLALKAPPTHAGRSDTASSRTLEAT